MDSLTVTVLRGGWWMPGRVLAAGETLALDGATAEALARRGIVRIEPQPEATSDAPAPAQRQPKTRRKPSTNTQ